MLKENIQNISIMGVHKVDLVMYCAFVLQRLGFRILVYDQTQYRELECCLRKPKKHMELVSYKEIDFAFSDFVMLQESYDYIFYVQDFLKPVDTKMDVWIYICDGVRKHLQLLAKELERVFCMGSSQEHSCLIWYRDLYSSHGIESMLKVGDVGQEKLEIKTCYHDCMDEAAYQHLQFQPFSHIADLSPKLESCLRDVLVSISGLDEKCIRRGIKLAKRRSDS